jgi:hypothetical protein
MQQEAHMDHDCNHVQHDHGNAHGHGSHAHHGHQGGGALRTSAHATLHCLTGCVVGEFLGLAIGVTLALGSGATIVLATLLSYVSGFTLGLVPVMRDQKTGFLGAMRIIWIGEAVSIGVMEIVMNLVDWSVGGMGARSIFAWTYWQGLLLAVPAGFVAAWPVNYWLIRNELKACH